MVFMLMRSLLVGAVVARTNLVMRRLEIPVPPQLLGRGEGLEVEFNHHWSMILSLVPT